MYRKQYHIHFVGIGGIGMSGIAELLLNLGYRVSGSDLRASDITERLARMGGKVFEGHRPEHVADANVVVTSSAVRPDNPEVAASRSSGVPVIPRAEMLAELMRLKYSVAVAGAHGKTTTTGLVAEVLAGGGLDPTVVIGGKLKSVGANALLGRGDFIVAEADESDGSFLKFAPTIAVVTNIDREHLDFYSDLASIQEVFLRFIDRIPFYGLAVLCLDSPALQEIIPRVKKRMTTYGLSRQAELQAAQVVFDGLRCRFTVFWQGRELGPIVLNLPGQHNVYNALASIAVGLELEIDFETIKSALENVQGVQRRLEIKGQWKQLTVIDDYGHHPTEIAATLQALQQCWPKRRKVVAFQPHRYSRTLALFEDFTRSFNQSDVLIVLPIYAASEAAIEGVTADKLAEAIRAHGHRQVIYVPSAEAAVAQLVEILAGDDILLTLGAGDVYQLGPRILERLAAEGGGDA
jgi:UDP-N-acetylmuramate--alanine ligase